MLPMAIRSTAARRSTLMGVAVAGALAGATGSASAQYYLYDDAPYLEQRFGYGYRYPRHRFRSGLWAASRRVTMGSRASTAPSRPARPMSSMAAPARAPASG